MPILSSIQSPQYRFTLVAVAIVVSTGVALLLYSSRVIGEIEQNNTYIEELTEN